MTVYSFKESLPDLHITRASRIPNSRIAFYLDTRRAVERAILHGFEHNKEYVEITPLVKPATRLVFSNVRVSRYPEFCPYQ